MIFSPFPTRCSGCGYVYIGSRCNICEKSSEAFRKFLEALSRGRH